MEKNYFKLIVQYIVQCLIAVGGKNKAFKIYFDRLITV